MTYKKSKFQNFNKKIILKDFFIMIYYLNLLRLLIGLL